MNGVFLVIFIGFLSTVVLWFDSYAGSDLWKQLGCRTYPAVTGHITYSEVTRHRGSKGRAYYGVGIRYRYAVNDRFFEGTRIRYNGATSAGWAWAAKTVAEHPVGSQTQVFYNPENPQDALLSPGVDGSDLILVLFAMPLNLAVLGLWMRLGGWLRERIFKPLAGGVRIITEGPRTNIRLPQYAAIVWCMVAVGGLSFASVLILGIASDSHPSLPMASGMLFGVAAAGAGTYWWQWRKIHSGADDLVLDDGAQTIELPETYGRTNRMTLAVFEIDHLTLEVVEHRGRRGVSYTYAPTLWLRGGAASCQKLADWSDQRKAGAFTDWLRQRLGLSAAPPERPLP